MNMLRGAVVFQCAAMNKDQRFSMEVSLIAAPSRVGLAIERVRRNTEG
jgi:hypothetical protein